MQKHDDDETLRHLKLRPAASQDGPFLLSLFASTRADELALIDGDEKQKEAFLTLQFNAQSWQYDTSYPKANHSIVLWDDVPIGRLLLNKGESEYTLIDIALLRAHRGAGIGTSLLRSLLFEAAEAAKPVRLSVWHSNPAKRLYERMGFLAENESGVYCEMRWNPTQT